MIKSRWAGAVVWVLVAPFAVWTALWFGGWTPVWQWVALVAFTPYVAAASLVPLLAALAMRRRLAAGVALLVCVALALAVVPRQVPDGGDAAEADAGRRLRVLAANLAVGAADTVMLMDLVRDLDPDVLAIQELTPEARERLEERGLRKTLPHRVNRAEPGVGGSGIYARHPLRELPIIKEGNFGQARAVLTHPGGLQVEIVSVHPCAPRYDYKVPCWDSGLAELPRAGGMPRVLAGDFNATLDHARLRELLASGYRDAADVTGQGWTPTWPRQGWEPVPGVTIDHVFADERIAIRDFRVLDLTGTDHRPVYADLVLPAAGGSQRE
ncbi:endonuclease/exonuclease/phosphatase (EEP) superfamily protein YafD [Thermocatellispora tengchongensis]|uniref:Endonuclease/exonuclease/phosphatase (EEP) superfamily protein YafD n=1 Tax=Thermocatellispora tengchongensis TaxID=1073253 RepID=A0A840NXT8_9ACTN|nr:endonuclease/exonuclease/phosphatase family protein [Thermocatellispora tengchongensis]MBB5131599.1 endonuclease/exonuclease/phosphatase (EEP) superfamily protein YafD [Thermocatellispora tengchongensis]